MDGKTPQPTDNYVAETVGEKLQEQPEEKADMTKYRCTVCGYIYDPALGDPDNGVKPGTPFSALPDGWVCPSCGAGKSEFEEVK